MKRQRSVKRIFSFSSGTLNRLGIWGAVTGSALDRAAGLLELRPGRARHSDTLADELRGHVAHAEQLDGMVWPAHQAGAEQRLGSHLDPVRELREVPHVDHLRGLPERVGEAALRDAPDERHLAALESGARLAAGPRRLPLAASAGRLADPRARTAALADARAARPPRRPQVMQLQGLDRFLRFRLRHGLAPLRLQRDLDEVPHLVEHAADGRVIRLDHDVLMVLEPQGLQRAPQHRRTADRRADLLDAERALPHRRQGGIAPRLALAVLARRGFPSHARPPGAACRRWCRAPHPAPSPRAAAGGGGPAPPSWPAPCRAGWSSPDSWSGCRAPRRIRAPRAPDRRRSRRSPTPRA